MLIATSTRARPRDAEVRLEQLEAVRREERDAVAVLDPGCLQRDGEAPRALAELGPGQAPLAVDDRGPLRERGERSRNASGVSGATSTRPSMRLMLVAPSGRAHAPVPSGMPR